MCLKVQSKHIISVDAFTAAEKNERVIKWLK